MTPCVNQIGDVRPDSTSQMYTNKRRTLTRVSDYFVIQDAIMETCTLRVAIIKMGTLGLNLCFIIITHNVGNYEG
jgi:hypothetical protein